MAAHQSPWAASRAAWRYLPVLGWFLEPRLATGRPGGLGDRKHPTPGMGERKRLALTCSLGQGNCKKGCPTTPGLDLRTAPRRITPCADASRSLQAKAALSALQPSPLRRVAPNRIGDPRLRIPSQELCPLARLGHSPRWAFPIPQSRASLGQTADKFCSLVIFLSSALARGETLSWQAFERA